MFWTFILILFVADWLVIFAFSVVLAVVAFPFSLLASATKNHPRLLALLSVPAALVIGGAQLYFWGGWAAFCSAIAHRFSAHPTVSHHWLYWLLSFTSVFSPIAWLSYKEGPHTAKTGCVWNLITVAAFIVFALWRDGVKWAYGWLLY
jgi:hypothetical protein